MTLEISKVPFGGTGGNVTDAGNKDCNTLIISVKQEKAVSSRAEKKIDPAVGSTNRKNEHEKNQ